MRLPVIDFLRGYSIFTIVIFHLFQLFPLQGMAAKAINFGGSGVHVFILCSGFGLCLSQLGKPLSYPQFLKKRFSKIYFPYIIIVLISADVPLMYDYSDRLMATLSHIFLFKMFNERWIGSLGYQLWFLSMIIQFYAVFPLLFKWVTRYRWKSVVISLIISLIWATLVWFLGKSELRIWNSFFIQYLWEFVLGMMLAIKFKENPSFIKIPAVKYLVVLAIIGIALVGVSGVKGGIFKLYNDIPSLVGYLSLALLVYIIGTKIRFINNFFLYTNQFSYEWYLVHTLVFITVFYFAQQAIPLAVTGVLALVLSYIIAIGYHQLLKKYLYSKL